MPAATHIYHNGTILTMDSRASTASCLAVRGDRIAAVGGPDDVAPLRGPDTRLVDLKGRTMLPGFYDCHSHYMRAGMYNALYLDAFAAPIGSLKTLAELAGRINPLRSALEWRIPFTNHNDSAVTPMDPLLSVWSAVNRRTASGRVLGEEQTIPVLEALRSVTTWGAWQFHEERIKGSLEPGKLADMTILAENPLAVAPRRLRDISVVGVLVGNELVFGGC